MSVNRYLLTGVPRSGTTLCCALLNEVDDTLALVEPWPVQSYPGDRKELVESTIVALDQATLDARHGSAKTKTDAVGIAANIVAPKLNDGIRRVVATPDRVDVVPLAEEGRLIVKHNAFFAALLPELANVVPLFAIVRNPVAVLASWRSVDLPVRDGRIPAGERVDRTLKSRLDACADRLARQLIVLDWFFARFRDHVERDRLIRYEEVVAGTSDAFRSLRGSPWAPLGNENRRFDPNERRELARLLIDAGGAFEAFYSPDELEAAAS